MRVDSVPRQSDVRGFTYIEAMLAMLILVIAVGIALSFFLDFGKAMTSEGSKSATQQSSRMTLDDLTRATRQIGYGVRRSDVNNSAEWQSGLVHGGSHSLAFNADIDSQVGVLPTSQTVAFPVGPSYTGEGRGATINGAETYVYTLDANNDGSITAADRTEAETGNYNPAAESANPLDFAVFRRVYGFNGVDYGGELEPLGGNLFTNATSDALYPDNTSPAPLFTYLISEDLDQDGILAPGECVNTVVDTCPPSAERDPVLYIWGDTNFDDALSESEKSALRGLEVGSAAWGPNPIATSGSYNSTTLSTAVAGGGGSYELKVVDATKLGPSYLIQVGTGAGAELLAIESVSTATSPHSVSLRGPSTMAHAVGSTVTVVPKTILNAVRAVELNFGAITPQRESVDGVIAAGRAGGVGTNGLDYRVTPLRRKIRVINSTTGAAPGLNEDEGICPLNIVNSCSGTASENSVQYVGVPDQQNPTFLVTDAMGNSITDVTVDLTQSGTTVGLLTSATTISATGGLATATYVLTGALGTDTVTASVTCIDGNGTSHTSTANNYITTYSVATTLDTDCTSTLSDRTSDATSDFAITVSSGAGPVLGETISLGLQLDPVYMTDPPDYDAVVGELWVDGSSIGTTDDAGTLATGDFDTDSNGLIEGTFGLASETTGEGARLELIAEIPQQACGGAASRAAHKVDFFKLTLEPIVPASDCSMAFPCVLSAGDDVPEVEATLSIGGKPIVDAPLEFILTDTFNDGIPVTIPPGVKEPESKLTPAGEVLTDSLGEAIVRVSNNGSPVITPATTLETVVDVQTTGPPDMCTNGMVASSSDEVFLDFETPMSSCTALMMQPYIVKRADDKMCMHILNGNEVGTGCPQTIHGIRVDVYLADGVTLDPDETGQIKEMKGGAVSTSASCSSSDAVTLFKDDCKDPKAILDNGEDWLFTDFKSCDFPEFQTAPGQFFTIHEIRWNDKFISGRRMDVTVYFECTDECDGGGTESVTYFLNVP